MNRHNLDLLIQIKKERFINQRILAENSGYSLGMVNRCLKELVGEGYLTENMILTQKANQLFEDNKPERAIILAAGYGMRMVPINMYCSKGLLEVKGQALIERTIEQLQEVGVYEIYIVVGFMKEQYDYLIDKYNVKLIVNKEYAGKNNLYSLSLATAHLGNSYIIPCDIWCNKNPYNSTELYSWYMVSDLIDEDSSVRVNRKSELALVPNDVAGNTMIGIAYITKDDAKQLRNRLEEYNQKKEYNNSFWEEALIEKDRMYINARVVRFEDVVEINTYEQLRELDDSSNHLKSDALRVIASVFGVENKDIVNIDVLKKGMTNRSFIFGVGEKKYIMRIPGEGTEHLINREEEADVYEQLRDKNVCDDIVYINPKNGYKITKFMENARCCDACNIEDLKKCMRKLREFHEMNLMVNHEFNLFKQIDFYESLWKGAPSIYRDYATTKANVLSLKGYIDAMNPKYVLTHIDAVPDNFLFFDENETEELRIIDWEYAGMQDPHVDIAMFCIYALYEKEEIDKLIDIYFEGDCNEEIRTKIYCYIAICGLLWSNWCEYKRSLGVEFGEYSIRQYRYAKDYFKIAQKSMEEIGK